MVHIIYTTLPNKSEAKALAHKLLDNKHVACVNIMQPHTAVYHYENQRTEETETAIWCKTSDSALQAAMADIEAQHPYDTPCILAWPASHENPAYSQWVNISCD